MIPISSRNVSPSSARFSQLPGKKPNVLARTAEQSCNKEVVTSKQSPWEALSLGGGNKGNVNKMEYTANVANVHFTGTHVLPHYFNVHACEKTHFKRDTDKFYGMERQVVNKVLLRVYLMFHRSILQLPCCPSTARGTLRKKLTKSFSQTDAPDCVVVLKSTTSLSSLPCFPLKENGHR